MTNIGYVQYIIFFQIPVNMTLRWSPMDVLNRLTCYLFFRNTRPPQSWIASDCSKRHVQSHFAPKDSSFSIWPRKENRGRIEHLRAFKDCCTNSLMLYSLIITLQSEIEVNYGTLFASQVCETCQGWVISLNIPHIIIINLNFLKV